MPSYHMTMLFQNDVMDENNPINATNRNLQLLYANSYSIAMADDDNTTLYQRSSDKGGGYNNKASYLKKFQNWWLEHESELSIWN